MADYYPLISRAVTGLAKNTGENRRGVYDRARNALLTQLRGITPPLAESDITRERLALEESIRKVEAESARQYADAQRQSRPRVGEPRKEPAAPPRPIPPIAPRFSAPAPAPQERAPRAEPARTPPPPPAEMRPSDLFARRAGEPQPEEDEPPAPPPAPRPPPRWAAPEARSPSEEARSPTDAVFNLFRRGRSESKEETEAPAAKAPPPPADEWVYPQTSRYDSDLRMFERQAPQERMFEAPPAAPTPGAGGDFGQDMLEPDFGEEHPDPSAARAMAASAADHEAELEELDEPKRSRGELFAKVAFAAFILALVAGIAGAAFWQWPNIVALYRSFRAPATETAREAPPAPNARTSNKIADRIEPGQQAPAALTTPQSTAAQKVVLYEEDPADPNGKRFVGSAVWRTETVTPGPGQPAELAIRADVEVPERKLAMTWSLRRNTDKGLPATHTVEIMFKLPTDFVAGGISNVPGILMKQAEQTRGTPLAGLAVKVTSGFYLIGLSNLDTDKERNLQLLKERAWFDIPVVYNNNRRAILAMEKGAPGERAFADAFKAWKQ
jgi:hypothetical protein